MDESGQIIHRVEVFRRKLSIPNCHAKRLFDKEDQVHDTERVDDTFLQEGCTVVILEAVVAEQQVLGDVLPNPGFDIHR